MPNTSINFPGYNQGRAGIDCGTPVNWEHPLNRGRLTWWLCLPGMMGLGGGIGAQWVDLCKRYNAALVAGANRIQPSNRWGGYGQLAANTTASVGDPPGLRQTGSMTVACWFRTSSFPNDAPEYLISKGSASSGSFSFSLFASGTSSTVPVTLKFEVATNATTLATRASSSTSHIVGTWYRLMGVYDAQAQTLNLYRNGVLNNGTLTGTVPSSQFTANSLAVTLGALPAGTQVWNGVMDDTTIWNRALSADEAKLDFAESANGYPSALRSLWRPRKTAGTIYFGSSVLVGANQTGESARLLARGSESNNGNAAVGNSGRLLARSSESLSGDAALGSSTRALRSITSTGMVAADSGWSGHLLARGQNSNRVDGQARFNLVVAFEGFYRGNSQAYTGLYGRLLAEAVSSAWANEYLLLGGRSLAGASLNASSANGLGPVARLLAHGTLLLDDDFEGEIFVGSATIKSAVQTALAILLSEAQGNFVAHLLAHGTIQNLLAGEGSFSGHVGAGGRLGLDSLGLVGLIGRLLAHGVLKSQSDYGVRLAGLLSAFGAFSSGVTDQLGLFAHMLAHGSLSGNDDEFFLVDANRQPLLSFSGLSAGELRLAAHLFAHGVLRENGAGWLASAFRTTASGGTQVRLSVDALARWAAHVLAHGTLIAQGGGILSVSGGRDIFGSLLVQNPSDAVFRARALMHARKWADTELETVFRAYLIAHGVLRENSDGSMLIDPSYLPLGEIHPHIHLRLILDRLKGAGLILDRDKKVGVVIEGV